MFRICLTHDVELYHFPANIYTMSLIVPQFYHNIKKMNLTLLKKVIKREKIIFDNPFNTFDKILALEKKYHAKSTFFFLRKGGGSNYNFSDEPVKTLIKNLDSQGWEIGLHSTYKSTLLNRLYQEKQELECSLGKEIIGVRTHGLKLLIPGTFENQKFCGFKYDTSFHPPFYMKKRSLKPFVATQGLLEIPLTIYDEEWQYMTMKNIGGSIDYTWNRIKTILDRCRTEDTICTVLWHPHVFYDENNEFSKLLYPHFEGFSEIYEKILQYGYDNNAPLCTCQQICSEYKKDGEGEW